MHRFPYGNPVVTESHATKPRKNKAHHCTNVSVLGRPISTIRPHVLLCLSVTLASEHLPPRPISEDVGPTLAAEAGWPTPLHKTHVHFPVRVLMFSRFCFPACLAWPLLLKDDPWHHVRHQHSAAGAATAASTAAESSSQSPKRRALRPRGGPPVEAVRPF